MSPTSASAYRRLVTVATFAAIAWTFACRPAWSPNSSQIVFPGKVGQNMALARYDLAKQTSEIIHINQIEQEFVVPHYLPNGDLLLLSMKEGSKKTLRVRRIPFSAPAGTKPVGPFEIETENNALDHLILPPVIVDGALFLGGKSLTRVDLTTGAIVRGDLPNTPVDLFLARRGGGICYITQRDAKRKASWEFGTIDPKNLTGKMLFESPKVAKGKPGWKPLPMPCFTKDLSRMAIPAERVDRENTDQTATAILVFANGKLENVLPFDDLNGLVSISSLAWAKDNVGLFSVIVREVDEGHRFSLYETIFSGSVSRETELITLPASKEGTTPALQMQLAMSPDGKWAATTSAYVAGLPAQKQSLLLIDVSGKERKVQRIDFPKQEAPK